MYDAFAVVSAYAFGEDGFVGEVEIDQSLPQSVPPTLFLQILLGILVQHYFHLTVQGLQLFPNAADFLLNAGQLCFFLFFLVVSALGVMVERGVFCPPGVFFALLEDAAELGSAETSYYGLIHIICHRQNNIRTVHQFLAYACWPSSTSRFYLTLCSSANFLGSYILGYFSFSPFLGRAQWLGVRDRMAGLQGTNLELSYFLLQLRTVPYFLSMNESQLYLLFEAYTVSITHFLNFRCSAQALQLSRNSKYSSLCQNSSGDNLNTFLLFSGTAS